MERRLPEGWEIRDLENLVDFIYGYPFESSKFNTYGKGLPIIRIRNLMSGDTELFYEGDYDENYIVNNNEILIGMDGGFNIVKWSGGKALLNQRICKLEFISEEIIPDFAYRSLGKILKQIEDKTPQVTVKHLSTKQLKGIQIPLPPLEIQRRIVVVLDKAEETRRLRAQADELAARLTNNIFLKMFGNPIQNPKDWPKIKLGDLCEIRRGASPRPIDQFLGGTVPWIKIGDGTKGSDIYIEETEEKIIEKGVAKSVFLKEGSLIFANCGVSLGFARILKIDGCIHDGWLSLDEINPMLNKIYILKLINMLSTYFRESAPDGTQPNLNTTIMKNFKVPVPPLDLQNKFAQIVNEVELFKQGQRNSKEKMDDFIGLLMQKAVAGELVA